jgi:glycosyltransferase involved in cell wall biosynthesis
MLVNPELSIIITSFNRQEVIIETLKSIEYQRFCNWECIIIDDCSTDQTPQIIQNFIDGKSKYTFIQNKKNIGVSCSRNVGLKIAKGEFFFFLDSDDIIGPNSLLYNMDFIRKHTEIGVSYLAARYFINGDISNLTSHGHNNMIIQVEISQFDKNILNTFYLRNPLVIGTAIYRKSAIELVGFFDENLRLYEDWDLHIRLAKSGVVFNYLGYVIDSLTYIRIHDISLMSQSSINNEYYNLLLKKHIEILEFAYLKSKNYINIKNFIPPILYLFIRKLFTYV